MSRPGTANENALPPYPLRHSGPVLVCGNAWCLKDDFERARALRPEAPVIAVNGAAGQVRAEHLYSYHFSHFVRKGWLDRQKRKFGDCHFTVHGPGGRNPKVQAMRKRSAPWVDYWWPAARGGGTSAWCAVKLAGSMGFTEIVLCGAPIEQGVYADGRMARDFNRREILDHYREYIQRDTDWHQGVKSMSGWTGDFFGEPA